MQLVVSLIPFTSCNRSISRRHSTLKTSFHRSWSCRAALRAVALFTITATAIRSSIVSSKSPHGGFAVQAWINNCRPHRLASSSSHRITATSLQRSKTTLAWSSSSSSLTTFTTGSSLRHSRIFSTIDSVPQSSAMASSSSSSSLAQNIDGKVIAAAIQEEIKQETEQLFKTHNVTPGLAVILVGQRRDSQTYVSMKKKACAQVGIASFGFDYSDQVTQEEILSKVQELNQDASVHGILIQLPLPRHIHEPTVLHAILPSKDVDGLHPLNVAALSSMATHDYNSDDSDDNVRRLDWTNLNSIPFPIACTPQGCIELLDRSGVDIAGQHAVVVGRSNLVGLPMSLLLLHRNATVTIVHSKTRDAPSIVRQADIVIAAVGRPNLVTSEWLKPGSVVIDVGINSVEAPDTKKGYKLVGDVDYAGAQHVCSKITPVPGGVGPMTIAMLLRNTLNACKRSLLS